MKKHFGFKTRLLTSTAVLLSALFAGFLYGIWSLQDYHLQKDFSSLIKSTQVLLKEHADSDIQTLSTAMALVCHDENLQKLWQRRDRAALQEHANPLLKNLNERFGITHFYFHEPDRVCFLRVHQPDRFGDVIDRQTLLYSQQTGGMGAGLELGPLGTLTLRIVQPWVIDGRVEGYFELGEEITHITRNLANTLNVQVAVLIKKSCLDRKQWINGMSLHDRAADWDDLPSEVILDCGFARITPSVVSRLADLKGDTVDETEEVEIQGVPYMAGATSLFDMQHRKVGRLVLFENIAPKRASLHKLMVKLTGFFLLTAAACLWIAAAYLTHMEKLLKESQRQALDATQASAAAEARHLDEILPFRKAIEGATDAIAILGLDRQLLFINPAFELLFGYTREEANAQGGMRNLYRHIPEGVKVYLKVSQGRSFTGEIDMMTKGGRYVRTFLRTSPIVNNEDEMTGILAIYTDLRDGKWTERELLGQAQTLVDFHKGLNDAGDFQAVFR